MKVEGWGLRVERWGFWVQGWGFRVERWGFRVEGVEAWEIWGLGCWGLECRVVSGLDYALCYRQQGSGLRRCVIHRSRPTTFRKRVWGLGFTARGRRRRGKRHGVVGDAPRGANIRLVLSPSRGCKLGWAAAGGHGRREGRVQVLADGPSNATAAGGRRARQMPPRAVVWGAGDCLGVRGGGLGKRNLGFARAVFVVGIGELRV